MSGNESIISLFLNTSDNTYDIGEEYFDSTTLLLNTYGIGAYNINGYIFGNNNSYLWEVDNNTVIIDKYNNWEAYLDFSSVDRNNINPENIIYCFNKDASILYIFSNNNGYLYSLNISND